MSQIKVNAVTDASGGNTATINSMTPTADSLQGFRNRIINGDMRIDQRNAGASITPGTNAYNLDRWRTNLGSVFTVQQSSTAPTGFVNSVLITSTASTAIAAGDRYGFIQSIEGTNISDLAWGSANAKTVTLSFWVRSSLTGNFGIALENDSTNRAYPSFYTINSANTWEYKTITIPGDTTGTWLTTTGTGIIVYFGLQVGSTYQTTANAWAAGDYRSATGTVNFMNTNGATWRITGVQLEVGSVATPFERRPYGAELELCRRYLQVFQGGSGSASSSTAWETIQQANPPFRATPALSLSGVAAIEDHAVTLYTQSSANVSLGTATALAFKYGLGNFSGLTNSRYYSLGLAINGNKLFAAAEL
jgi:hypothetical protein